MPNMMVADAEYQELAEVVTKIGSTAEECIEEYFSILNTVLENAVPEGKVHQSISSFYSQASQIKSIVSTICDETSGDCTNFVSEIDEKDQYLY